MGACYTKDDGPREDPRYIGLKKTTTYERPKAAPGGRMIRSAPSYKEEAFIAYEDDK